MRSLGVAVVAAVGAAAAFAALDAVATPSDPRDIRNGFVIPSENYCDQPYVVVTDEGNWLCVMTTGPGREGDRRQHVVATISPDKGRTWSPLIDIEPHGPPEASWAMPLKVRGGRIYVFYVYNGDNVRRLGGRTIRADMLGHYVFKYSDDGGRTWSRRRWRIPVRPTAIDRRNDFGGKVQMFWGVGKPVVVGRSVYFGFSKIGKWLVDETVGFFFRSRNILAETDPAKIAWEMLPEGDEGVRAPKGPIAEEHNLVALSDGTLYCVFRTVEGYLGAATSRDGGRTWSDRQYATYRPGGRPIKNPRGPAFVRKFSNGRYLLLYYNHSGTDFRGRNPYWISGGVEKNGAIHWSQPEICLYDEDAKTRIGYPDFIEDEGRIFLTETQKSVARVHELDPKMLNDLWRQGQLRSVVRRGLVLSLAGPVTGLKEVASPRLADLSAGGGFTVEFWIRFADLSPGRVILDSRNRQGRGFALTTTSRRTVGIDLCDGKATDGWDCDRGLLGENRWHHMAVVVDGAAKIITFIVDGVLCDGGRSRQHGWHRLDPGLGDLNSGARLRICPSSKATLRSLRIYGRYLRTSEVISNYRAGLSSMKRRAGRSGR